MLLFIVYLAAQSKVVQEFASRKRDRWSFTTSTSTTSTTILNILIHRHHIDGGGGVVVIVSGRLFEYYLIEVSQLTRQVNGLYFFYYFVQVTFYFAFEKNSSLSWGLCTSIKGDN